jgi:hypothetical protein
MCPRPFRLLPSIVAMLTCALSVPASAQTLPEPWADPYDQPGRVDLSFSVGAFLPTDWSDLVVLGSMSPSTGVLEQVLVRDMHVNSDTQMDGAITYWRGRYGFRVQAGLAQSSVTIGGPFAGADDDMTIDMDTWLYDVRGAIGLVEYAPQRRVWPYGFFGFGGITYDLDRPIRPSLMTFIERPPVSGGPPTIIVQDDNEQLLLAVDQLKTESVFTVSYGIGTDVRVPVAGGGIGLRFELSDQVAQSPVGLRIAEVRHTHPLAADTGVQFRLVHHFRAAVGIVVQVGR